MATIGTFTKHDNGGFIGTLETLTLKTRASFEPAEKRNESSPAFRVTCGLADFGAAWERTGKSGRYLSVVLDDPSFAAPIHCRLVQSGTDQLFSLMWERPKKSS